MNLEELMAALAKKATRLKELVAQRSWTNDEQTEKKTLLDECIQLRKDVGQRKKEQHLLDDLDASFVSPPSGGNGTITTRGVIPFENQRNGQADDGIDLMPGPSTRADSRGAVIAYRHGQSFPAGHIDEEERGLDLGLWLRGKITGEWEGAEREKRAMGGSSDILGGYLLPSPMSREVIDLVRNKSIISAAGARAVPMTSSTLKLVKVLTDPTGFWRGEGQAITESDMSFGSLTLKAKVLAAICRVNIELVEDTENAGTIIKQSIAKALALELDRVGLFGSGTGAEPLGLYNTPNVLSNTPSENGDTLTNFDLFSVGNTELLNKNCTAKSVCYAPWVAGKVDLFKDSTGQPLRPPKSFEDLKKLVSNQIPVDMTQGTAENASCGIMGDFSNMLIGVRQQVIIEATRTGGDDAFSKMQILIRAYIRADIGIARADHFYLVKGLIPG